MQSQPPEFEYVVAAKSLARHIAASLIAFGTPLAGGFAWLLWNEKESFPLPLVALSILAIVGACLLALAISLHRRGGEFSARVADGRLTICSPNLHLGESFSTPLDEIERIIIIDRRNSEGACRHNLHTRGGAVHELSINSRLPIDRLVKVLIQLNPQISVQTVRV